jgi:hypothetical protein
MANENSDDFAQAIRLLHVVRAWAHTQREQLDPARQDPLYPAEGQRVLLFSEVSKLLDRYPYEPIEK